jgi:hypothetical protein
MRLLPSDEDIIEGVRSSQRHRRAIGAICAVLGVSGVLLILYFVNGLYDQSKALHAEIARASQPTTQQVATSLDETCYVMGFTLGFLCAGGLAGMSSLAAHGCVWLLTGGSRKDKLLLKCWDARVAAD